MPANHASVACLHRGALIVLEGVDRCGKSTQSRLLAQYLNEQGHATELWSFPDRSTTIGGAIDAYLSGLCQLTDEAIHLLFSANRWEKVTEMKGKLQTGTTLIVDRYAYSGVAYSAAKGLDLEWCKIADKGLPLPDAVIYFDMLPEHARNRGGYGAERYENLAFQSKVYHVYEQLKDATWHTIDASQDVEQVQRIVRVIAQRVLQEISGASVGSLLM